MWLSAAQHLRQGAKEPQTVFTENLGSHHLIERGSNMFPAWLRDDGIGTMRMRPAALTCREAHDAISNTSAQALKTCSAMSLAVLHDPAYRAANAGALQMEWPRIPLPGLADGESDRCGGNARQVGGARP